MLPSLASTTWFVKSAYPLMYVCPIVLNVILPRLTVKLSFGSKGGMTKGPGTGVPSGNSINNSVGTRTVSQPVFLTVAVPVIVEPTIIL